MLQTFMAGLLGNGDAEVTADTAPFTEEDKASAVELLREFYKREALEMPGKAPAFDPAAALWAAEYLYRASQLILLRYLGEAEMTLWLQGLPSSISPEVIFSVDLVFRNLGALLQAAGGLSPDDPLVVNLRFELTKWPFSAVLSEKEILPVSQQDVQQILEHPSLAQAYTDRIIRKRKHKLADDPEVYSRILATLGDHADKLWPGFKNIQL